MPIYSFDELYAKADQTTAPVPVVAAGGADATVIQALDMAARRGWVRPILAGDPREIRQIADGLDIDLDAMTLLDAADNPAAAAVAEIRAGRARMLMKGQIATPLLMQAVLSKESGLRTGEPIAQVVLMEITRDDRRFLLTDTGITPFPTLDQKRGLLRHLVQVGSSLGAESPRVAVMSATEKVTDALPDTHDAAALAAEAAAGEFGTCQVAGPLSFDLAYAREAGEKKRLMTDVTGAADAMLFPDLLSANLTVKAMMYTADARFGGVLCGTSHPVVFMSRADHVSTRMNSLALVLELLGHPPSR